MSEDKVRDALAELVAATNPDGETSVADWRKAWAAAQAALSEPAPGVAVPDGWQLVPKEPTREMLDAYVNTLGRFSSARADWAAMLAAAPTTQEPTP